MREHGRTAHHDRRNYQSFPVLTEAVPTITSAGQSSCAGKASTRQAPTEDSGQASQGVPRADRGLVLAQGSGHCPAPSRLTRKSGLPWPAQHHRLNPSNRPQCSRVLDSGSLAHTLPAPARSPLPPGWHQPKKPPRQLADSSFFTPGSPGHARPDSSRPSVPKFPYPRGQSAGQAFGSSCPSSD